MRVLLVRVGAMGDVVHALPAVTALRRAQPSWELEWAVDPRWAPLLSEGEGPGPAIDRLHLADTRLWSASPWSRTTLHSVLRLRRELRARRFDLAVDLQGTLRSGVIGRMAGAGTFAGYADPRESLARNLYSRRVERRGAHVVEQGAALLGEACGVALAPAPDPTLPHAGWADAWAAELDDGRPLCVLAAAAGWGAKQWPAAHYGKLAQELRAAGFRCVVNAPRADDARAAEVVAASAGSAETVICNVAGLIALLRRAALAVGGDTGPLHVAAALGVPLVGLYGPTDPARNGPWGPGAKRVLRDPASQTSHKRIAAVEPGLARLGVEQVLAATRKVLGEAGARQ